MTPTLKSALLGTLCLPFSTGRQFNAAKDSEFVLLRVPELLEAR